MIAQTIAEATVTNKISRLSKSERPRCIVLLVQLEFAEKLSMQGGPDSIGSLG